MSRTSRIPGRLGTVFDLVPAGARVADIGTGHGLLAQQLVDRGRAVRCVAVERRPDLVPRRLRERSAAEPRLELRFGDGLRALRPEDRIQVVVLAGMGARAMVRILSRLPDPPAPVRRLVLQPQTEAWRLRHWLAGRGMGIVAERLVRERGRPYVVIAAEPAGAGPVLPAHESLGPDDLLAVGPCLVRSADPRVREHWERTLRHRDRIVAGLRGTARDAALRRREQARRILAALPPVPEPAARARAADPVFPLI